MAKMDFMYFCEVRRMNVAKIDVRDFDFGVFMVDFFYEKKSQ